MLPIGYLRGIRSERRLVEEVHPNLAHRRFCRLGLDGWVPERSTFSENRHGRFAGGDLFRAVFEDVVRRCAAAGIAPGGSAAVDGSFVPADARYGTPSDRARPPQPPRKVAPRQRSPCAVAPPWARPLPWDCCRSASMLTLRPTTPDHEKSHPGWPLEQ
jgi:Transposase domain (DUF772)